MVSRVCVGPPSPSGIELFIYFADPDSGRRSSHGCVPRALIPILFNSSFTTSIVLTLSKTGFKRQGAPPGPTTAPASVEPKPEAARTSDLENGFEKTTDVDSNTASTSAVGAEEEVALSQNAVLSTSAPEARAETV